MENINDATDDHEEIKIPLWLKITFLVFLACSIWMIYCYGIIIYLVFLLPFVLIMSLIASVIGLLSGKKEDQIFYMISLSVMVAILAVIVKASTESVFRDEE
ncbi:hypothetical protein [Gimesia aquarii]|uniref:Uncharacterized protein n=1 Tax=Gimesia aquarii TaxID=2527964 RepID=A0A517VQE6_9PLAN|nr:hypothetical protein [Gimesia aquarii]QDT95245.1 hypothetical protein V144x_06860 [Gimesia aquarii]